MMLRGGGEMVHMRWWWWQGIAFAKQERGLGAKNQNRATVAQFQVCHVNQQGSENQLVLSQLGFFFGFFVTENAVIDITIQEMVTNIAHFIPFR